MESSFNKLDRTVESPCNKLDRTVESPCNKLDRRYVSQMIVFVILFDCLGFWTSVVSDIYVYVDIALVVIVMLMWLDVCVENH